MVAQEDIPGRVGESKISSAYSSRQTKVRALLELEIELKA
jgi:hypothetical protein